jgi:hypothetical protein
LPLVPRVFAVAAAVFLVGSVALASLLPADMRLDQAIQAWHPSALVRLQAATIANFGHGLWSTLFLPFLGRPVWLIPVCLGILCVGGAVSALTRLPAERTRRRS